MSSLPSNANYSKDEIKRIVHTIEQKDWLELPRMWADKDGGGGEYIQSEFFHIQPNPQKLGDLGTYELKTHRSKGKSLITLGSLDPKTEEESLLHDLLKKYGYPYKNGDTSKYLCRERKEGKPCQHQNFKYANGKCYPDDELALGIDICGKDVLDSPQNKWGFYLDVNRKDRRLYMRFDPNRASSEDKYQKWLKTLAERNNGIIQDIDERYSLSFAEIEKSAKEKFHNMVFLKYLESGNFKKKSIKVIEAYFLEKFDFARFLTALENGSVMYELRMHGNKERISKNHGTGFRMFEKSFTSIYDVIQPMD